MKPRDVANPDNRFHKTLTTYDDGEAPPAAAITILDDSSRSILSSNDSPDLGFSWSANPYRGCLHACSYCLDGATPILLGNGRTRPIADLVIGDEIYGTRFDGTYRRYERTQVLDHWRTRKRAYRVTLGDGSALIASGDHRFLSNRGWKYVMPLLAPILPGARALEQSASDLLWLLTEADAQNLSGQYVDGRLSQPGSNESRDRAKIGRAVEVANALLERCRLSADASVPTRL